ncbi:MAG: hypothetical protein RLZZ337_481 [Bacteroidota bacterium]|jgi:hypothetical protein
MKAMIRYLLLFIILFTTSLLQAATISSTTAGGDWSSTSTWTGGVIPGSNDNVIIKGNVYFYSSAPINNLTISTAGQLFNRNGYGCTITVNGSITNAGKIANHPSGGSLYVNLKGNISNQGIYFPSSTTLLAGGTHNFSQSAGKYFEGAYYKQDTVSHIILGSYVEFYKASVDGYANYSYAPYYSKIVTNGYNMKFTECNLQEFRIESYGNQQHPSATNTVNTWWRLKPTPATVKDSIEKLRLYYRDADLEGKNENDLRVYFSPNAGLNWNRIEKDVTLNASNNEISILNAPPYGHYLLSDNDLGIISFTPIIQRAEPKVFGNKGQVTVYGFGIGLNDSMNVYLKKLGSNNIVADTVYLTDAFGESFIATFNVDLADIGQYSMVLELAGQSDLELNDYFTIENAERPEPWVVLGGRNKFLINRWQTFTINYGNKANTDAIGVPLFFIVNHIEGMEVEFPDFDIGVQKSFIDDGWTQWQDTVIDLYYVSDEFKGFEGKMMRLYPFYVPTIGAMSSESVRIRIKVPSVNDLNMSVWITDPMYEGIPNKQKAGSVPPEVAACINAAAGKYIWDKAIGFIPGYDCYKLGYKVLETGVGEVMKDPNEPPAKSTWFSWVNTAWGWTWSVVECAGDIIPVGKGVKIAKDLIDIAFETKSNYDATQDCWDKFRKKQQGKLGSTGVYSFDPNEIAGPSGYGEDGYIEANADMVYTVYFENKDSATAAAQEVVVLDTLDKTKFDFSTLSFQDVTIADSTYDIQSFAKEFRIVVDLAPRIQTLVQVTGSLDTASGELKVSYVSLDRSTMELQEDVDLGFLPPNKTKPEGEGNFSYAIALKPNLSHDAEIINKALIFFDGNKPIATNVHKNTIDKIAPSSMVNGLATETTDSNFVVSWGGTDPGCGIQDYTIMVSVNDSDFVVWKSGTSHTSDTFFGHNKTRYAFYSIATDSLGLTEGITDEADASTYVKVNTGAISDLEKQNIVIGTNAATDLLTIKLNEPGEATVYDISGRLLMQSRLNAGVNNLIISHLIPQTYVVVVNTKTTEVRRKIVVLPN